MPNPRCRSGIRFSVLLAQSETAFLVVKYIGVTYLVYLAFKTLRQGAIRSTSETQRPGSQWRIFIEGCLTNLLNPKVALFILAFLPQFADPAKGHVGLQIFLLSLMFNFSGTVVNIIVAVSAGAAGRTLTNSRRFAEIMRWATASVFTALALRLAFQQRQ